MSRPPMPVRYEKKPIRVWEVRISAGAAARIPGTSMSPGAGGAPAGSLATAEQIRGKSQKCCNRQTHDVPVVAVDRIHEGRALTLDRVAPGPVGPLASGESAPWTRFV